MLEMLAFEDYMGGDEDAVGVSGDEEFQGFVDAVVRDDPSNFAGGSRSLSRELEAREYMDERGGRDAAVGTDVFVRGLGARRPTRVTRDGRSSLVAWSPDGLRLLYATSGGPEPGIWSVKPDGSDRRAVVEASLRGADPHSLTISADGAHLFFASTTPGVAFGAHLGGVGFGAMAWLAVALRSRSPSPGL
jgi:hypothetical protein